MTAAPHDPFAEHMPIVARALFGNPNPLHSKAGKSRWGNKGSLSIDEQRGVWFDHENSVGGGVLALIDRERKLATGEAIEWMQSIGCRIDNKPSVASAAPIKRKIVESYDYIDTDGELVLQALRFGFVNPDGQLRLNGSGKPEKTFGQRRPFPGKLKIWIWGASAGDYVRKGPGQDWHRYSDAGWAKLPATRERHTFESAKSIPYRLPELIEAIGNDRPVFVVEGEQKVDALAKWNLVGTCNVGGAGKWTDAHADHLRGADVCILPDNDDAGRAHAELVALSLTGKASRIRVTPLPGLAAKGDIVDWQQSHTREEMDALLEQANDWQPATPDSQGGNDLPPDQHRVGQDGNDVQHEAAPLPPLPWINMHSWDGAPIPKRKWAIADRVPLRQAGLFSGEGGVGKSILELTKNAAHVLGKDWLGSLPEVGPAVYLGAEDDVDELHIRLADIAAHYGVGFKELMDGGLHVLCLLGQDATLCATTRSGRVETTALYRQIYEAAGDIKPKNISIDTLSRAFAGNEIDRTQVYAFAMYMQALAMVANGSVTVLSHPSLAGMASGSGISGSTAWHGAFRFRQYLTSVKSEAAEQPDTDLRELQFKKNQYGPRAESVVLRYRNGLFLPEAGISNLDQLARDTRAEEVFLDLLKRFTGQGRNVGDKPNSPTYAPAAFAKENEAKSLQLRKADLESAMRRLFSTGKIHVESYGRPSRPYTKIAVK